jgi:GTPase SAR1 family protein
LGQLTKLGILLLRGNPLESPPPEVVGQGTKAVLAYLRELAKGERKRYEAKLILLGYGNEGKTCVSRALRGLPFKEQIRTEGVEVVPWEFAHPDFPQDQSKKIKLNIWDFEGQEINHQSHQFFLTEQSLYVLVINGRREFKMGRAEYWLDTIRARAPKSRVILVASECENTTPSWPLDKIKGNYGDLLQGENWYFPVGCQTRKGIDDLAAEIKRAAGAMKLMGTDWPVSYQRAEDAIRDRSKSDAQVSRAQLYQIFEQSGISEEGFKSVAGHMATLGVVTQFRDSPELADFVVLNPQWLTKAISLVMEDEQLEDDKGEITHQRMRGIWDRQYQGLYPAFHNCLKEFELCYDMEDKAGCLVPLRFGSAVPDIPWSDIPGAKERRIEYRLSIRPPMGIMSRFIVKTHYMIATTEQMPKGVYWHNGVFLRTGEGENASEALCEFNEDERTLSITVRAAFPQNMVEQLHGFGKAVFGFFEGLKPERKYGCVKFEAADELQCRGAHAERRILFALSREKEIDCDAGWHVVDPKRLVYGFSSFGEDALTVKELQQELAKKPQWAEGLIEDVKSSLVWIDKIYDEVLSVRGRQEQLGPEIAQRVSLRLRAYLRLLNELLDNRDFNSAPALVSIVPVDGSGFNPKNWFEKEYLLTPYCEYEREVHSVDFSLNFTKPRAWWEQAAPKVATAVKVLSAGVQIACAGLPMVNPTLFEAMKNDVKFMKELAKHLELEGGAVSDISADGGQFVEHFKSGDDFRQGSADDQKRIARMQLAQLLKEIAPKEYDARLWGALRRVRMADNTYRWLCAKHAEIYRR